MHAGLQRASWPAALMGASQMSGCVLIAARVPAGSLAPPLRDAPRTPHHPMHPAAGAAGAAGAAHTTGGAIRPQRVRRHITCIKQTPVASACVCLLGVRPLRYLFARAASVLLRQYAMQGRTSSSLAKHAHALACERRDAAAPGPCTQEDLMHHTAPRATAAML